MPNSEVGHAPNRFYFDQSGNAHLNGSSLYLNETGTALNGSADALTAIGTAQSGALALTNQINNITTSTATSSPWNGVSLPLAYANAVYVVRNTSANPIQVYSSASGTDTINGVAGSTGVILPANSSTTFQCTAAGAWFSQLIGIGFAGSLPTDSFQDSITAAGTGQSNGYQLTFEINRITTGAATTGVILPLAAAGLGIIIINHAPNSIHVYGAGTDTIDDVATATGVVQMANSTAVYYCTTSAAAGKWYSNGIGTGFSGQYPTVINADNITAAGTNQAGATQLAAVLNRVTTSAATAAPFNGVLLPASAPGMEVIIENNSTNPIQVYGTGTDTINGYTTTLGVSQPVNACWEYSCTTAGNWVVQLTSTVQPGLVALSGTADAISPHLAHTYVVTKAGVDAMTLAAPTATTDDGISIVVTSSTANAHTITATGLLQTGTASVNTATFAAQKGAGVTLLAYQGKWQVLASVGITFS